MSIYFSNTQLARVNVVLLVYPQLILRCLHQGQLITNLIGVCLHHLRVIDREDDDNEDDDREDDDNEDDDCEDDYSEDDDNEEHDDEEDNDTEQDEDDEYDVDDDNHDDDIDCFNSINLIRLI